MDVGICIVSVPLDGVGANRDVLSEVRRDQFPMVIRHRRIKGGKDGDWGRGMGKG